MNHHGDSFINIPFAVVLVTMPWWIYVLENTSWVAAKMIPIIGLLVAGLQIWYLVRKLRQGGKKPE